MHIKFDHFFEPALKFCNFVLKHKLPMKLQKLVAIAHNGECNEIYRTGIADAEVEIIEIM